MQRLVFFILISNYTYCQSINQDSVVFYFEEILNFERYSMGLKPLTRNKDLGDFTNYWSVSMAKNNRLSHGTGETSFNERIRNSKFKHSVFTAENVASIPIINLDIRSLGYEYSALITRYNKGGYTTKDFALLIFQIWKKSPPHYETLLSPNTEFFWLSISQSKSSFYFSFLCLRINL
jgi:uncharacterized protein YkwD